MQATKLSKQPEPYGLRPVPEKPFSEISVDHKALEHIRHTEPLP